MKLKNKKTGEINIIKVDEDYFNIYQEDGDFVCPVTLKELNDGWEDAPEEPKEYWYIDTSEGSIVEHSYEQYKSTTKERKEIGNYFVTEEEAELAVRKLRAWKRLKDNGCRFILDDNFAVKFVGPEVTKIVSAEEGRILCDDYRLLFGGEE